MHRTVINFNLEQTELHLFGASFGLFKFVLLELFLSSGTGIRLHVLDNCVPWGRFWFTWSTCIDEAGFLLLSFFFYFTWK